MGKVYCNKCDHCISYISQLDGYQHKAMKEQEDGRFICSSGMNVVKNWYGEDRVQLYDKRQHCEHCGSILSDAGQIRYGKCEIKNRNKNCKEFKKVRMSKIIVQRVTEVRDAVSTVLTFAKAKAFAVFIAWAFMHSIVATQISLDLFGKIYIGASILFFTIYVIDRA